MLFPVLTILFLRQQLFEQNTKMTEMSGVEHE